MHVPLATRVEPQGVAPPGVAEKSPLATMLAMVNAELRLLLSVTICGGLVAEFWDGDVHQFAPPLKLIFEKIGHIVQRSIAATSMQKDSVRP